MKKAANFAYLLLLSCLLSFVVEALHRKPGIAQLGEKPGFRVWKRCKDKASSAFFIAKRRNKPCIWAFFSSGSVLCPNKAVSSGIRGRQSIRAYIFCNNKLQLSSLKRWQKDTFGGVFAAFYNKDSDRLHGGSYFFQIPRHLLTEVKKRGCLRTQRLKNLFCLPFSPYLCNRKC